MNKHTRRLLYFFLPAIGIYLAIVFAFKPSPLVLKTFGATHFKYWVVVSTVDILSAIIWLIAYYGFSYLQNYADTIKNNPRDGIAVAKLTRGFMILVFQLPITSLVSTALMRLAQHTPRLLPSTTIISHYVSMLLPLLAFIYISYGARGLTESVKQRPSQRATLSLTILLIVMGTAFTFLLFKGIPHNLINSPYNQAVYYLPNWLLLFTLVIPYIFTWFVGIFAAYETYLYMLKTPGILYRRAWKYLVLGFGWIIAVSALSQYVTVLTRVRVLEINALLFIVYGLLVFLSIGYILVAVGAKKLQRIEEV